MDYKIFSIETKFDLYEKYAKYVNRPLVIVDRKGINNSEDQEAIEKSLSIYETILPAEIFSTLKSNEIFVVLFHSNDFAEQFAKEFFPQKETNHAFPELEILVTVMDGSGSIRYTNKS